MITITLESKKHKEILDVTDKINEIIIKNKIKEGVVNLFLTHTTAALTTVDEDPGIDLDLFDALEGMIPKLKFRHPHNSAHTPSHILSSIIGTSLTLLVENGELILGTWQRVVLVELDGPKERHIFMNIQLANQKI